MSWARRLGLGAVQLGLALLAAEAVVRLVHPTPRTQIVRQTHGRTFDKLGDTWVWTSDVGRAVNNLACIDARPQAPIVLFVGDSIFSHVSIGHGDTTFVFTDAVQDALDARGIDACVVNLSEPAFNGAQQLAVLERALATYDVAGVVWEVFKVDGRMVRIDDAVYETSKLLVDAEGTPSVAPDLLPSTVNRFFFRHSAAWQYASLVLAGSLKPSVPGRKGEDDASFHTVAAAQRLVEAEGAELAFALMPNLSRPFAETAARGMPSWPGTVALAEAHGLPVVHVAEAFADEDVEALRLDTCCHYNPAGHRKLAELFTPLLAGWLRGETVKPAESTKSFEAPVSGLPQVR